MNKRKANPQDPAKVVEKTIPIKKVEKSVPKVKPEEPKIATNSKVAKSVEKRKEYIVPPVHSKKQDKDKKGDNIHNKEKHSISSPIVNLQELEKGKEIKIYSWNVNGLRSVIDKGHLDKLMKTENPDILFLNETKLDQNKITQLRYDKLYKPDYEAYWNCCTHKLGYSGTAVFTKFKPISVNNGIGIEKHDTEGRVITLEFESFFVVGSYIPNAGDGLNRLSYRTKEWDIDFRNYLQKLREKKNVIWCGDINVAHKEIDLFNPKGNIKSAGFTQEERNEFNELLNLGYVDTFRHLNNDTVKYSFWSARSNARETNKGWRLDYFVVNQEALESVRESEILPDYIGSDHCPIKLRYMS